ncbi:MAG: sigma-70 factor domain-containing protein, partial [Cyanobacteria bacterium J06559_3]
MNTHQSQKLVVDLVRTYLKEIGQVPMLTHEQEVVYGKAVQALVKLEKIQAQLSETLGQDPALAGWAEAAQLSESKLKTTLQAGKRA